jgi:hypothetical protein
MALVSTNRARGRSVVATKATSRGTAEGKERVRLERHLRELAKVATRAREALRARDRQGIEQEDANLQRAMDHLMSEMDLMVGGVAERLEGLNGVLQTLNER